MLLFFLLLKYDKNDFAVGHPPKKEDCLCYIASTLSPPPPPHSLETGVVILRNICHCSPERDPDTKQPRIQGSSEMVGGLAAPHRRHAGQYEVLQ